ncbi:MAG: putative peptidoglycan binding domain [Verrucomicrobiota bacterium]|jgi:hypothetical protein|nr:putative peptidoglycan binding domain [Verrucomicrobiota bacterium]
MKLVGSTLSGRSALVVIPKVCRLFSSLVVLETLLAISAPAQTRIAPAGLAPVGSVHINSLSQNRANLGVQGLPTGPSQLPYPMRSTPANDAAVRNNAWAAYNANLHQIPTAPNPNRLAAPQKLVDQDRFIQQPNSARRYNFQFSDNEIRSVQRALRRTGNYSGQVDGILGPDTKRAIQEYQLNNKLPVTGQPDQGLNALLGIF